jgi:hypothetical protein
LSNAADEGAVQRLRTVDALVVPQTVGLLGALRRRVAADVRARVQVLSVVKDDNLLNAIGLWHAVEMNRPRQYLAKVPTTRG